MTGRARGETGAPAADPADRAREIALKILGGAPRSAAQLRASLLARDVPEVVADEVIERYREVGLIDDAALAHMIMRTRHLERGQSRKVVEQELRRKGFEPDDIASALAGVSDEAEAAAGEALAAKRWKALAGIPRDARARRVVAHLGRKGYAPGYAFDLVRGLERADIWEDREVTPAEEEVL